MAAPEMVYFTTMPSPVGDLLLTSDGTNLTGLYMTPHRHGPDRSGDWQRDDARFVVAVQQLREYFDGTRTTFDLKLKAKGTDFQRRVWAALCRIPFGATVSYGAIARDIGNPAAVRAVGLANGRNPISIIVPCHRVIGSDGSLTGYGGGIERKEWLLKHEGVRAI
jgi:methylated-DNA-[protein]-cysteine S-methyltransferase